MTAFVSHKHNTFIMTLIKTLMLKNLWLALANISTTNLSMQSLFSVVKLREELKLQLDSAASLQKIILDEFGESNTDGSNPELVKANVDSKMNDVLNVKMNELFSVEIEVANIKFFSEEEFYEAVKGCSVAEIEVMSKYLIKEEVSE